MSADGPEQRTADRQELAAERDEEFDTLLGDSYERDLDDADVTDQLADEPDDDYYERAAERADLAKQELDQDLRDAGRGHLVRA